MLHFAAVRSVFWVSELFMAFFSCVSSPFPQCEKPLLAQPAIITYWVLRVLTNALLGLRLKSENVFKSNTM